MVAPKAANFNALYYDLKQEGSIILRHLELSTSSYELKDHKLLELGRAKGFSAFLFDNLVVLTYEMEKTFHISVVNLETGAFEAVPPYLYD